jgi:hypothetical protein
MRGLGRKASVLGIPLSLLVAVGCGVDAAATTPAAMTMLLGPALTSLTVGQSFQFTVRVSNVTNSAVTWSVDEVTGGNSTVGTISSTGLYTAPALVPNPASVTVTATSMADASQRASVRVTILGETPQPGVVVTITSPSNSASVTVGQTLDVMASVTGASNTALTWTVTGALAGTVTNGSATIGTIPGTSANATYKAPSALPTGNNPVTITATSQADPTQSASVTVTINPSTTNPNAINVPGNDMDVAGVNLDIPASSPTLGLADVGTCAGTLTPTVDLTDCAAGVASVTVSKGTTAIVWLLGQGLTNSDGTALASGLSVGVSQGTNSDVRVTQVTPLSPTDNPAGLINIAFQVSVGANATSGPRNLMVTNRLTGELQAFVGAIQIP